MKKYVGKPKRTKKMIYIFIIGIVFVFCVIPLIINYLFKIELPIKILIAEWGAGDALTYVAGSLAFVGTMFLGWVSWKQNVDLQTIERNSFIAENSCMSLITEVKIKDLDKLAVNIDHEHPEQIVISEGNKNSSYNIASFVCEFQLKRLEKLPAMVRVDAMSIFMGEDNCKVTLFTKGYDKTFSRIAISEKMDRFSITVFVSFDEKEKIINVLHKGCRMILDVDFELVTGNFVSTRMKCRAELKNDVDKEKMATFDLTDKKPMCFWFGNTILDEKEVIIRCDT